jgi:hypothetical protein
MMAMINHEPVLNNQKWQLQQILSSSDFPLRFIPLRFTPLRFIFGYNFLFTARTLAARSRHGLG